MNAPRTIPRATVVAALESLGIDIPLSDIMDIHLTGNAVTATTWPHFDLHGWRIVDECPSCHTADSHPHTEYCQLVDHASQLTHLELNGPATGPNYRRPCSCPGLGINPDCRLHNHDPAEDEPEGYGHRLVPSDTLIPGVTVDPEPWVDDGCRCPTRDNHLDGCPAA